jgi:hypothetical protein
MQIRLFSSFYQIHAKALRLGRSAYDFTRNFQVQ